MGQQKIDERVAIQPENGGKNGLLAELQGGTHNDDAWAPEEDEDNPQDYNFGRYQLYY